MGEKPVDVEEQELPGVNPFIASRPRHPGLIIGRTAFLGHASVGVPGSAHQAELDAVVGARLMLIP